MRRGWPNYAGGRASAAGRRAAVLVWAAYPPQAPPRLGRRAPRESQPQSRSPPPTLVTPMDPGSRTAFAVNLASIIERADEQVLPAMYSYVGASLSARADELGGLTFARAVCQALWSPVGGVLGHNFDRSVVIAGGCALWGTMTVLFGMAGSVSQALPLWALNGVGLSMVIPNVQSLTADCNGPGSRGKAFGVLALTAAMGGMLGQLYATNVAASGGEAWRFVMFSVGMFSILVGLVNLAMVREPRARSPPKLRVKRRPEGGLGAVGSTWQSVRQVMSVPTFIVIVVQGIVGTFPWNAIVFMTHYLQLIGMSGFSASCLMGTFLACTGLGGLIGGIVGDKIGARYPRHGRILAAQFSVAIKLPFVLLLLRGLPLDGRPSTVAAYGAVMCVMALLASWAGSACNNPVFAEVVPSTHRNLAYAFDRSFEGAIAACGAPIVGWLAQSMGYVGSVRVTGIPSIDLANAHALGSALLVCLLVPWTLCFVLYTGLHWTYQRDKVNAQVLEERGVQLGEYERISRSPRSSPRRSPRSPKSP